MLTNQCLKKRKTCTTAPTAQFGLLGKTSYQKDHMPSCPCCKSNRNKILGRIPSVNYFAGSFTRDSINNGILYECLDCNLHFKFPIFPENQLNDLYIKNTSTVWKSDFDKRHDWITAKKWIDSNLVWGDVLDVGCYDGGFLSSLSSKFEKFGIEPNLIASQAAKNSNINVIGNDFRDLKSISKKFDVIIAVDVIEHVENPLEFLSLLRNCTKPKGLIIVSSGTTDSLIWRIAGSQYWYCALAEHMSFINLDWCTFASKELGLEILNQQRFCHYSSTGWARFRGLVRGIMEATLNVLQKTNINSFTKSPLWNNRDRQIYGPAKDHLITLYQKLD